MAIDCFFCQNQSRAEQSRAEHTTSYRYRSLSQAIKTAKVQAVNCDVERKKFWDKTGYIIGVGGCWFVHKWSITGAGLEQDWSRTGSEVSSDGIVVVGHTAAMGGVEELQ